MAIFPVFETSGDNGCDSKLEVPDVLCEACAGLKQVLSEMQLSVPGSNSKEKRHILRTKINQRHDPLGVILE